jgi:hypothetical protein
LDPTGFNWTEVQIKKGKKVQEEKKVRQKEIMEKLLFGSAGCFLLKAGSFF